MKRDEVVLQFYDENQPDIDKLTTCVSLVCSSSIYRTFIKTLNELSYYKLAFYNLRELAQVVKLK